MNGFGRGVVGFAPAPLPRYNLLMLVREVSEFSLIEMLTEAFRDEAASRVGHVSDLGYRIRYGIGEDAAAWDGSARTMVATTDTLVEGIHFRMATTTWTDLGWKSMVVNQSDVAAMGCAPVYSLVTLGLREDLPVDGLKQMYSGMADASRTYGGVVVGGDTVSSPTFFITVAMFGAALKGDDSPILSRNAAAVGDKIAVTGNLGCSAGGLRMMHDGLRLPVDVAGHLTATHTRPSPRVLEGEALVRIGVKAAIDVSDGLVDDLGKVCKASGVGAVVYSDRVPVDAKLRVAYPNDWLLLALSGGEDYELLFVAKESIVQQVSRALDTPITVIGDVVGVENGLTVLGEQGNPMALASGGWNHFRP